MHSAVCMARCGLRAAFLWLCKPQMIEDHVLYHNGKSLEQAGSVTGEVVLSSGLVDAGRCSQDSSQQMHGTSLYYRLLVPHIMGILS